MADSETLQESVILSRNLPPRLPGNKIALRYRIKLNDESQSSNWSTVYYIDGPQIDSDGIEPANQVGGVISASSLTSNVATITTTTAHGLSTGDYVNIFGRTSYNGIYQITNTGSTTFTYSLTSSNVTSNTTDGGYAFIVNHTDTTISHVIADAKDSVAGFSLRWTDANPLAEYDIFVYNGIQIGAIPGGVNVASSGTTKTIYFNDGIVPQNFSVGDYIDVVIRAELTADAVQVTGISSNSAPYYIQYTGDSSNTLANTAATTGFIGLTDSPLYKKSVDQVPYEYLGTYVSSGDSKEKTVFFAYKQNSQKTVTYDTPRVLVQAAGSKRIADPLLKVVETQRV